MGTSIKIETCANRSRILALPSTPTGLITGDSWGKSSNGPGANAYGASANAEFTRTSQARGRQRGDGSRPSGKNKNTKGISDPPRIQTQEVSQAAATPPGREPWSVDNA